MTHCETIKKHRPFEFLGAVEELFFLSKRDSDIVRNMQQCGCFVWFSLIQSIPPESIF